jgi:amino acid transporter
MEMDEMSLAPTQLRGQCLNFWEILAQAIALISPTMTAALIVPLMYGTTGNASWLAYAFGTIMLLFVAFNLNQFAKRSATTGSMYSYIVSGLGLTTGGLGGWCLIWAYAFIGTAGVAGFTIFASQLLGMAHVTLPPLLLFAVCVALSWFLAVKDIQLSTILMLILEGLSVAVITILAFIVLSHHGFAIDMDQVTLKGNSLSSLGLGVVIAIFSLVGFECATAFGEEAKNPLKTIPRAVIASLLLTGAFFIFISYVEIQGLNGNNPTLDKLTTPLSTLATLMHVDVLQIPIDLGAMVSFFSLALSCMNAGARLIYQMGREGVFHGGAAKVHPSNGTPANAISMMAVFQFFIPTLMLGMGLAVSDAFNDAGTFGAFGFLGAYFFVTVATPMYLKKIGELRSVDVALSVVTVVLLLVPAIGSVYPVPSPPVNAFPYVFGLYFLIGLAVISARHNGMTLLAPPQEDPYIEERALAS